MGLDGRGLAAGAIGEHTNNRCPRTICGDVILLSNRFCVNSIVFFLTIAETLRVASSLYCRHHHVCPACLRRSWKGRSRSLRKGIQLVFFILVVFLWPVIPAMIISVYFNRENLQLIVVVVVAAETGP